MREVELPIGRVNFRAGMKDRGAGVVSGVTTGFAAMRASPSPTTQRGEAGG
jgi:hypothetical protein